MTRHEHAVLGQVTAERDGRMLDAAFYESPDFVALRSASDTLFVVGRRGSGKSAIFRRLQKEWEREHRVRILTIVPREDQVIGLRTNCAAFGDSYKWIRAGSKIAWKYALFAEIAAAVQSDYKIKNTPPIAVLRRHCDLWRASNDVVGRLRTRLDQAVKMSLSPERRIGSLDEALGLQELQVAALEALSAGRVEVRLMLDSLDEGYEPDAIGTGLIGGLLMAMADIAQLVPRCRCVAFVRDALYRALKREDRDFSRNIEPHVLRLSWNEPSLLDMLAARMRVAFNTTADTPLRIWNACVARGLENVEGFRRCLSLTLYRPRDLLRLLNEAYAQATRKQSARIVLDDIDASALEISRERRDDLVNEYRDVIPGLPRYIDALSGGGARLSHRDACHRIGTLFADIHEPEVQQDLESYADASQIVDVLYGTGIVGVRDESSGTFVFSHDGKAEGATLTRESELLVHPAYWKVLNLQEDPLREDQAQEIHDEYDPEISGNTAAHRAKNLSHLVSKAEGIPVGEDGQAEFEEWCLKAVRLAFAGHLRNCELHPNKSATTQRDVVGRNAGKAQPWEKLGTAYGVEQVIFEVKNYSKLAVSDFQQLLSYLVRPYGRIGFFITRGESVELRRNSTELNQVQHMWNGHKKLMVVLTHEWFVRVLKKLRNASKHEYGTRLLDSLIDCYQRKYVLGQGGVQKRQAHAH